jgi:predicted peroxiredoxin
MRHYVFLETRDPFELRDGDFVRSSVQELKNNGSKITVYLVQNAVLASRKNSRTSYLSQLHEAGAKILVDDFSLKERSIANDEIHSFLDVATFDQLVDLLMEPNTKAIWH